MRVLVTGGTGFIGTKVAHALRAVDHDVRALVRNPARARALGAWGCELAEGDVTDATSLARAAEGCECVVHLVAIIVGRPTDFERIMEQGTRNLATAATRAGVQRFVLMSALGTREDTKDLVPYFKAKWEMERAVRDSGLDHVVFRPSFVFGREGILPTFIRQVRYLPVTPVVGSGETKLQPIWVDDVAAYVAKSVELSGIAGRTFDLGGPDVVTWNELYARIRQALGARRPTVHVPFGLVRVGATLAELLPRPPVTRDQLTMLERSGDNVCDIAPAVDAFGIQPIGLDEQLRRAV
jgi:NADH dehydrogenase